MDKNMADRLIDAGLMKRPIINDTPLLRALAAQVELLSDVVRYMFDEIEDHGSDYCKRANREQLVNVNINTKEIKRILDEWMEGVKKC